MPSANDNRSYNVEHELFHKLTNYHAYPSTDGEMLYSMVASEGIAPIFITADRMQVAATLQEANMAHLIMVRRAGADPGPLHDDWILKPQVDLSPVRFNHFNQHVSITHCFTDRLPVPMSYRLPEWKRLVARIDAAIR
jgi:hypothetical protein